MSVALLVLRVVVGALFAGHGSQKLFGWFKGHGLNGTGAFFESIGLTPGVPLAFLAGASELAGGVLLGVGLFLPVACLLLVAVMATAIATVHWKNGVWAQNGGIEYPLVLAAVAFTITAIGPGLVSLDNLFGIDWASLAWAIGATVVGVAGGLLALAVAHSSHQHHSHGAEPHAV
jgi:putative oxidoreductase